MKEEVDIIFQICELVGLTIRTQIPKSILHRPVPGGRVMDLVTGSSETIKRSILAETCEQISSLGA